MPQFRHLFPSDTATAEHYTYAKPVGGGEFKTPPRDDRPTHGGRLIEEVETAAEQAQDAASQKLPEQKPKGIVLDFASDPGFKLKLESLEMRRSGVELCSSRVDKGVMHATVFVPEGKVGLFVRKFEAYVQQEPGSETTRLWSRASLGFDWRRWKSFGPMPERFRRSERNHCLGRFGCVSGRILTMCPINFVQPHRRRVSA